MWPFSKNNKRTRRNSSARRVVKLEKLESRELFAADAFVGMYQNGMWTLDQSAPHTVAFGLPGDQAVMGDWNGNGSKTPGIYRNGTWVLDLTGNGYDAADRVLAFGLPGDKAVAGDWNGNGIDTVGVFRDGLWFFDQNGDGYDASDAVPTAFGWSTDKPVVGDWNGDGRDTPGVYRQGTWALDLTGNGYDAGDRFLQFGLPNDQPVAGDWNGDGKDTPAVLQGNQWFFDLEGNGYTGESGQANRLGTGVAVAGKAVRPIAPPAAPEVDVVGIIDGQATAVSFGTVSVGGVATRDFTVRNLGSANLTLGQLQVPPGFIADSALPGILGPGTSAAFRVRMDTSVPGTRSGTIQFTSNDADESPYNFHVSGLVLAATQPEVDVVGIVDGQASAISFGTAAWGAVSTRDFTVRNLGNGTLTLGPLQVPTGFSIETQLPASLAPGASVTFRVRMETTSAGTRGGTVQFSNNDADESPYNFVVTGTVLAQPQPQPEVDVVGIVDGQSTEVSFGTVAVGAVATKDFTVRNLGTATLVISQVQVPLGFSVVTNLPGSLAPGASATLRLRMDTATAGSRGGTAQIASNDADESTYNFVVSGTVVSASSNFGMVVDWQRIVGPPGVLLLKSVRTYNASGNNMRLFGDFSLLNGTSIRRDVPIGDFALFGDQTMPTATPISNGRYAIAWRNTNLTRTGGIHYAIIDTYGAYIGARDLTANISYSANLAPTSITAAANGGFRIAWMDTVTGRGWRRDFNSAGVGISGEVSI